MNPPDTPAADGRLSSTTTTIAVGVSAAALVAGLGSSALASGNVYSLAGLAASAGVLVLLVWAIKLRAQRLLPFLFAGYALALLLWVATMSSQQTSDFGVYYRCGLRDFGAAGSFADWLGQCRSRWLPSFPAYWRRSLLYTVPLGILVGDNYLALKVFNLLLHVGASWLLYRVVSRHWSKQHGALAALPLVLGPEHWFSSTLATSDNLAVLFVVLWLGRLLACLRDRTTPARLISVLLLTIALDLLRDIGPVCVLAFALTVLCVAREQRRRALVLAASSVLALGLERVLILRFVDPDRTSLGLLATAVGNGILTRYGGWTEAYRWHVYGYPALEPAWRGKILLGLAASDLAQGAGAALANCWRKLGTLFSGTGYYAYATMAFEGNPDSLSLGALAHVLAYREPVARFLGGVNAAILGFSLVGMLRSRTDELVRVGLAFFGAFVFLVVGAGETQARYSVLLLPCLGIAMAGLAAPLAAHARSVALRGLRSVAIALATLVLASLGLSLIAKAYLSGAPVMTRFGQEEPARHAEPACNLVRAPVDVGDRAIRIEIPDVRPACFSFSAELAGASDQLVLQVIRDPVPPRWKSPPESALTFHVESLPPLRGISSASTAGLQGNVVARIVHPIESSANARIRFVVEVDADPAHVVHSIAIANIHDGRGRPAQVRLR